jgi:cysteine desulfurase / selenocysteine lyase
MACQATGAQLKYVRVNGHGRLDPESLDAALTERTRLVAVAHTSNVLGTINPVTELAAKAHRVGAKILVDAAQSVAHGPVDVAAWDCDFLAFSGHKMFGPTGIGVLYAKPELLAAMEPVFGGGGMIRTVEEGRSEWAEAPWRFEAGTPPIAEAAALGAAVDYVRAADLATVGEHEAALTQHVLERLAEQPGVVTYGPPAGTALSGTARAAVVSFNVGDLHPHDVAQVLDQAGVAVRGGHHCCQVLMRRLGVTAVVRASFSLYNTEDDVERLIAGLDLVRRTLHG